MLFRLRLVYQLLSIALNQALYLSGDSIGTIISPTAPMYLSTPSSMAHILQRQKPPNLVSNTFIMKHSLEYYFIVLFNFYYDLFLIYKNLYFQSCVRTYLHTYSGQIEERILSM